MYELTLNAPHKRVQTFTQIFYLLVNTIKEGLAKVSKNNKMFEKTCFQNKFKFITEDHFSKHVNITIHELNSNETLIKTK